MTAYYNEFDPNAAAWLRELIKMNMIAPGEVDERSITDVTASDLRGFTQHHFFAGVGVWSYSLRRAGWEDSMPVCTASLPCQPFSAAGKRKGKDDERHLLPHFLDLVKECDFPILFGEQVAPAIKQGWLDDLYDEMEQQGYTCGASVLTAAGAGSPHIRQRIYWTAIRLVNTSSQGLQGQRGFEQINGAPGWKGKERHSAEAGMAGGMGNAEHQQHKGRVQEHREEFSENSSRQTSKSARPSEISRLGNAEHDGHVASEKPGGNESSISECEAGTNSAGEPERASPSGIISSSIEWLYCRDEKYRPIKSGIAPLVDGSARGMGHSSDSSISPNETSEARVMRLKGYGNAIQADVATEFIGAVMECL